MGQASVPSRFLLEIPAELMDGPQLGGTDDRDLDLDLVFGARRTSRFGTPVRGGHRGAARRSGRGAGGRGRRRRARPSGRGATWPPSARPTTRARRQAPWPGRSAPGTTTWTRSEPVRPAPARATRPIIPGERQFRDGDRVRHARWGDGIVVTSKLTRSDEEVTVAFKDASVGRKTMLVSLANLDIIG